MPEYLWNSSLEKEIENMSFQEAPQIVTEELPGPKSRELLAAEADLETPTRVFPMVMSTVWSEARGATVRDPDGNCYIDLTAGIAVNNVGHCNPKVVETIQRECSRLMHNADATNPHRVKLGQKLQEIAPGSLRKNAKIAYGLSGSSAGEIALKFARAATGKSHVVALHGAYHGALGNTLALTTSPNFRSSYKPLPSNVYHVGPYAYCYRCPWDLKHSQCNLECARFIEYQLLERGTGIEVEDVAAMIVEPVQGEGGYVHPPAEFLQELKRICEKAGILYIDDEVQAGMGRTGKMFAVEHSGVDPDMVILGKALGGDLPFSAVITRKDIGEKLPMASHLITAVGNATSAAVACTNLDLLQVPLLERTETVGNYVISVLKDVLEDVEIVGEIRGRGLMIGVELVKNRETKKPLHVKEMRKIVQSLRNKGVLLIPSGRYTNVLRLMPPLVITRKHLDRAMEILSEVLKEVQQEVKE